MIDISQKYATVSHWARLFVLGLLCTLWLTAVAYGQDISQEDKDTLHNHGAFLVAYPGDYAPFSYTDDNGVATGMAIHIMNYMAQFGNFQVDYVTIDEAKTHGLPVDINLGILQNDQLPGNTILSIPYTKLQMMAVSDDQSLNADGATVGHLPYAYLTSSTIRAGLPGCTPYTYRTYDEMAGAFSTTHLDYMLVSSLIANQMLESDYQDDTYVIPVPVQLEVHLAFSHDLSSAEIHAFNRVIASLDEGHIYNLMLNAVMTSKSHTVNLIDVLHQYAQVIIFSILIVFAVIATIILRMNYIKQKSLTQIINEDKLTGLMTELKFHEELQKVLHTHNTKDLYIISIDINNFKSINEVYGYEIGTQTIVRFSQMLQRIFPSDALISHFAADNFVILYKHTTDALAVHNRETFDEAVHAATHDLLGESYRMSTSAGIYPITDVSLSTSYMVDCANLARRQRKTSYDNSKTTFDKTLEAEMHRRNQIVMSMEKAMVHREFQIYYQPKVCLTTETLTGAEALIRWIPPDGKLCFPDEFIPLFESNGFIVRLDYFVLDEVCRFLANTPSLPKVAINISGVTILEENLVNQVRNALHKYQVSPHRLEVEITESAVASNFDIICQQISRLKKLGVTLAMDDFGAGISSLNRLSLVDFDILKIDRAFLDTQVLRPKRVFILQHIISLAHQLNIQTVAEGVEYPEQVTLLQSLGCDIAQGYHYAKPMDQSSYLEFVHRFKTSH